MAKSYVAVADEAGLRAFVKEDPTVLDHVLRWHEGRRRAAVLCFRALVSDEAAEAVHWELAQGERLAALSLLDSVARELERLGGGVVATAEEGCQP